MDQILNRKKKLTWLVSEILVVTSNLSLSYILKIVDPKTIQDIGHEWEYHRSWGPASSETPKSGTCSLNPCLGTLNKCHETEIWRLNSKLLSYFG